MTKTRLIFIDGTDGAAATLTFDEDGRVIARATLRPDAPNLPDFAYDILVVPGVEAAVHRLSLPMRNEKQARGAAAILLEDSLAAPMDEVHLALGAVEADGSRMVVAVADATMRAWLAQAARLGVTPAAVAPSYALLPEPDGDSLVACAVMPSELAVRGTHLAAAVEPELLSALVGARPLRRVDDPAERERLLGRGAAAPAVNLLQGPYDPAAGHAEGLKDYRLTAILACVLLVSPLILWTAQIVRDRWAAASYDARTEELADRLALGGPAGLGPDARLRLRLAQLEGGEAFVRAAAVLFGVVEQVPGAEIANLFYGGYGQVRATIAHPNYSDADGMKVQAARYGYVLVEDAASTENGRVMTDVVVEARR